MGRILSNPQFLLITGANLALFLVLSSWSFLPVFVVDLGGTKADAGLLMGSIGITSLGSVPLRAPLIVRWGRKVFIVPGVLLVGVSNLGFMFFDSYSPLMILVRLVQGIAFAGCFNGCSTAIVDLLPPERRAQGIGLFGASSSLAVAVGPYISRSWYW
ncbi:MAG: MFS transporter [Pseudomonadota bacterium]